MQFKHDSRLLRVSEAFSYIHYTIYIPCAYINCNVFAWWLNIKTATIVVLLIT